MSYYVPFQDAETEFTEKRSRFIGHVWRTDDEDAARRRIDETRKKYHDARHNCWCYLLQNGVVRALAAELDRRHAVTLQKREHVVTDSIRPGRDADAGKGAVFYKRERRGEQRGHGFAPQHGEAAAEKGDLSVLRISAGCDCGLRDFGHVLRRHRRFPAGDRLLVAE